MLAAPVPNASSRFKAADLPPALAASPLLGVGGFLVVAGLANGELLRRLRSEAFGHYAGAVFNQASSPDAEVWRGGCPERAYWTSAGGPVQDALYHSPRVIELLSAQVGLPVAPTGARGSFSYYRPGCFLGLHRDVETCDLAVITCLYHGPGGPSGGGGLAVYPSRTAEPLPVIRGSLDAGMTELRLEPGQTLLLLGGIVPHQVLPVARGKVRVVSVLCYRALLP